MTATYVDPTTGTRVEDLADPDALARLLTVGSLVVIAVALAVIAWWLVRRYGNARDDGPTVIYSSARGDRSHEQADRFDTHLITAWRDDVEGPER